MSRLAWSHMRFRPARVLALILGVLIAATAFTVLTGVSRPAEPPASYASPPGNVIRVTLTDFTPMESTPRERLKVITEQIEQRTGLDLTVVADSWSSPVDGELTLSVTGATSRPPEWLFTLILAACVLFVANAASAAVRGRRRELGMLAAVGWRRSRLFATILGEVTWIGLVAGLLAAAIAMTVSAALGLASPARALLAVPVAMAVTAVGALVPAWLAARTDPAGCARPPVPHVRGGLHPGGISSLALLNATRTPGRAVIAAISLAMGIAALTTSSVTFHDRGVDYLAAGMTVAFGVLAVTDVALLNVTERAAELVTIRGFGWRDAQLARLVITEGVIIGIVGSVTGALAGLGVAAGQLSDRLIATAMAAAAAGILITAAAALLPAALLRRLLAEE
jgi:putative ABC transport system permease protein